MKADAKDGDEDDIGSSKAESKITFNGANMGGGHQPTLVHKLVDYAFRMLSTDMGEFFARHVQVFDQDANEVRQQGETIEQYHVFQEYLQLLEEAMDEFVKKEGFKNIEECYAEVERQVHDDTKRHEEEMKKLYAHLQAIQAQYAAEAKGGSTDAKGGMADDKDAKGEGMVAIPMVVLFQPITLEKLLDMVLNLSEYTTFSLMMRMKVTQLKMWKILEAQAKEIDERGRHLEQDSKCRSELKVEDLEIDID